MSKLEEPKYFVPVVLDSLSSPVSLSNFIAVLSDRSRIALSIFLSIVISSVLFAFLSTPLFRAETVLAPAVGSETNSTLSRLMGQFGGLASLSGMQLSGGSKKNEALATLQSKSFIFEFINEEKLLPLLFPRLWNAHENEWKTSDVGDIPTLGDGYKYFLRNVLTIKDDQRTGLITLAVEWRDPIVSAIWANLLVSRVNSKIRQQVIDESEKSIEFLNRELSHTSVVEVRQSISNLIEAQVASIMYANVSEDYAFKVIDIAIASDIDDFSKPDRFVIILLGLILAIVSVAIFVSILLVIGGAPEGASD
ncbi:MAG: hypothetical protein IH838_07975 [Proteobacteria bacterium]|nr:hypothetical protein [Pseudomonadota bacterium]